MVLNSISPLRLVSYVGIAAGLLNLLYAVTIGGKAPDSAYATMP